MTTSIVACGQKFEIGTRVVLWDDPGGFNAYDTSAHTIRYQDRKTGKTVKKTVSGKRYSKRTWGSMNFKKLQKTITQFFLHHSGLYRSKTTFNVLHNERKLSVHFILDDDGTIYQTLDLKEKAWHGGGNNPMSIGIEIDSRAHASRFPEAYDETHQVRHDVGPRTKRLDKINGSWVMGYEYNETQYLALIKLGIALTEIFPLISADKKCDFPRTKGGLIIKSKLSAPKLHRGVICHYNNNSGKNDPISFDHERFVLGVNEKNPYQGSTFLLSTAWEERQQWLKNLGYNPGPVDGVFGPKTKKALQEFQSDCGLHPDGKWGYRTDYMLDIVVKGKAK